MPDVLDTVQEADRALKRLAGAMLINALEDLSSRHHSRRESALQWMARRSAAVLSFDYCCSLLGQDAERVRDCFGASDPVHKVRLARRVIASRARKVRES